VPTVAIERLGNGATLVAIQISEAQTFTAQTFLRTGSVYESEKGSAHLLEHLLFADGEADALAENAGLLLDATTYREFIRLHTVGKPTSWRAGAAAVARLLRAPNVAFAEREANVIAQEDALARLDPDEMVHRALWQSVAEGTVWANLPMGNPAKPPSIVGAFERHVTGPNIVAVVASASPTSEVITALKGLYGSLPKGRKLEPPVLPEWSGARETVGTRFGVAAIAAGYDEPSEFLAAEIAIEALTSPARLDPVGLAAKSFLTPSSSGSLVVLSFEALDGAPGLSTRVSRALGVPITPEEFRDARARIAARYAAELPSNLALTTGLAVLFTGATVDFSALVERVTLDQSASFAKEFTK
jgi:hypothetical protein